LLKAGPMLGTKLSWIPGLAGWNRTVPVWHDLWTPVRGLRGSTFCKQQRTLQLSRRMMFYNDLETDETHCKLWQNRRQYDRTIRNYKTCPHEGCCPQMRTDDPCLETTAATLRLTATSPYQICRPTRSHG